MKIKDAYIGYNKKDGLWGREFFGGFKLINNSPKQIKFTKSDILKRVKELTKEGCKITTAEISTYDVENNEYAELIDPIKIEQLL